MIDIDSLLDPISPENPAGPNLRLASGDLTYGRLEELRRETDAVFDAGGEARTADWKGVVRESTQALREKSKDLQLAAILTQGLVGTEGIPGLVSGLRLMRQLIDRYWETLHPGCEDGEIILPIRARPLAWVGSSREFLGALKRVPVAGVGPQARSWLDYENSRRVDEAQIRSDQQAYRELIDSGYITGEQWKGALAATPPAQVAAAVTALREAEAELEQLRAACDARFGDDAPAMIELRNLLGECADQLARSAGGEAMATEEAAAAAMGGEPGAISVGLGSLGGRGGPALAGGQRGPIATREQAYQQLREVAEFLRCTEPHSPVALLLDRAVKWEKMSFAALFEDVVKNSDARAQLAEFLGLEKQED